jgi:excisionase family DNA binding protein
MAASPSRSPSSPLRPEPTPGAALDAALDALAPRIAARVAALLAERMAGASPWLDTKQAADYLACSQDRLHDLVARRVLQPGRDGRRLLFKRSDLDAYVEAGR